MPGISNGPNSRPLKDTIAETGPGVPDDANGLGDLDPLELGRDAERQIEALRKCGWTRFERRPDGDGRAN